MPKSKTVPPNATRLYVEALEDRCLLSADHFGTLTLDARQFLWVGESVTAANRAYRPELKGPCGKTAVDYCETTLLHVEVDPGYWDTHDGAVRIDVTPHVSDDLDLRIYRSNANGDRGDLVANSHGPAGQAELAVIEKPTGYYLIDVNYFSASERPGQNGYTARALLVPPCPEISSALGLQPVTCEQYAELPDARENKFVQTRFGDFGQVNVYTRVFLPSKVLGTDGVRGTADDEQVPVIVAFGPYGVPATAFYHAFVHRGYALVVADSPGTGGSGGCYDFYGEREQESAYDIVEWAAVQPWSVGKVGMMGDSAYGASVIMTAAANPSHLATIVATSPFSSLYDVLYHDGVHYSGQEPDDDALIVPGGLVGTPFLFDYGYAMSSGFGPLFDPPVFPPIDRQPCPDVKLDHTLHYSDVEPDYDAFWQERDWVKDAPRLAAQDGQEISFLGWGGWEDKLLKPAQNLSWFEAIPMDDPRTAKDEGVPFKMLRMEPLGHGVAGNTPNAVESKFEWPTLVHAWFDQFFYGYDTNVTKQPAVLSKGSDLIVRQAAIWPAPGTADVNLFLRDGFTLSPKPPHPHAPESLGTYLDTGILTEAQVLGQRDLPHGDFLWFESNVLQAELRLAGHPVLKLLASTSETSTHFTPVLFDLGADGTATRIAGGFLNARYKDGLEQGHDLVPGETYDANVRFEDNDYIIPVGHRFGLAVMSSNTEWAIPDQQRATNSIFSEHGNRRSILILPIVGGKEALNAALPDNKFTEESSEPLADIVNALSGGDSAPTATNGITTSDTSVEAPTSVNTQPAAVDAYFAAAEDGPNTAIFPSTQLAASAILEGALLAAVLPLI